MATLAQPRFIPHAQGKPEVLRCKCGTSITAPPGATPRTRYICPACAEHELRKRGVDPARVHFDEPRNELSVLRLTV